MTVQHTIWLQFNLHLFVYLRPPFSICFCFFWKMFRRPLLLLLVLSVSHCFLLLVFFLFLYCYLGLVQSLLTSSSSSSSAMTCVSFDVNRKTAGRLAIVWRALSSGRIRNSIGHAMTMFSSSSSTQLKMLSEHFGSSMLGGLAA